jgi:hypothetical protein
MSPLPSLTAPALALGLAGPDPNAIQPVVRSGEQLSAVRLRLFRRRAVSATLGVGCPRVGRRRGTTEPVSTTHPTEPSNPVRGTAGRGHVTPMSFLRLQATDRRDLNAECERREGPSTCSLVAVSSGRAGPGLAVRHVAVAHTVFGARSSTRSQPPYADVEPVVPDRCQRPGRAPRESPPAGRPPNRSGRAPTFGTRDVPAGDGRDRRRPMLRATLVAAQDVVAAQDSCGSLREGRRCGRPVDGASALAARARTTGPRPPGRPPARARSRAR